MFASAHRLRARIVPTPMLVTDLANIDPPTAMVLARRLDWAQLLRRVWGPDVTSCPCCGDTLRVIAFISHPDITAPILERLGLATVIPIIASARAPPEDLELAFP